MIMLMAGAGGVECFRGRGTNKWSSDAVYKTLEVEML